MAFTIEVVEKEDATGFKLYDLTDWAGGFDHTLATSAILTVEYNNTEYTYNLLNDLDLAADYLNFCGNALNSYFVVTPDKLLSPEATALNTVYFPDGYYDITLDVVYNTIAESDNSRQGFVAELYLMASKLPLLIDIDNFDYEENRLQFLCIALLNSCTWAGQLGREAEFNMFASKANAFLDARAINEVWST